MRAISERLAALAIRVRGGFADGLIAGARSLVGSGDQSSDLLDEQFLRRLERLSVAAQRSVKAGLIGEHRSVRKASSFEFADYRHYVPGDDFRRIDWNAFGRLEQLFLKLTEAKEDVGVHLLIDASRSMAWGRPPKLTYARQVAAALGYIGLSRYDTIIAAAITDHVQEFFSPVRGKSQALNFFRFLSGIRPVGRTHLQTAAQDYVQRISHRGVVLVISDLLAADGVTEGIDILVQRGLETAVIHLLDQEELDPRLAGDVELFDVETEERIELTLGPQSIRSYHERMAAWTADIEAFCARRGVKYLRMNTSLPFEGLTIQYFRQRRLVR